MMVYVVLLIKLINFEIKTFFMSSWQCKEYYDLDPNYDIMIDIGKNISLEDMKCFVNKMHDHISKNLILRMLMQLSRWLASELSFQLHCKFLEAGEVIFWRLSL